MKEDNLSNDYNSAGYNKRLGFGNKPALILVDFVKAYFDPKSPLYASVEENLESAIRILEQARLVKIPIIYTNVVFQKGGWNGGMFIEKVPTLHIMEEGGELGKWGGDLKPLDNELVISKQYPSAFFGTTLASSLNAANIDTLIITGVTTSGCIRATCIDTVSHGFRPIIVEEAVGDRDERPHKANLFDMNAKYGDVVTEKEVIEYLNKF
ncbi:MAG: Maleamate amidohydrolase [Alphaproteobacteria bacterium MarineAlpha2_Bin1]|nr:MAG: Maleamate amidohydrolase [Alphaproteobacteria bacterium MarineAlpha2_Bin1]